MPLSSNLCHRAYAHLFSAHSSAGKGIGPSVSIATHVATISIAQRKQTLESMSKSTGPRFPTYRVLQLGSLSTLLYSLPLCTVVMRYPCLSKGVEWNMQSGTKLQLRKALVSVGVLWEGERGRATSPSPLYSWICTAGVMEKIQIEILHLYT